MIIHQKVQTELMQAISRAREARVQARKQVDAAMSGHDGHFDVKGAFREHALATAAHNLAVRELRDYHLNGHVPSRLEALVMAAHQQVFAPNVTAGNLGNQY